MNSESSHPSVSAVRRRMRVRGDRPAAGSAVRRRRMHRASEAVVAGYIQELSQRRRGEHGMAPGSARGF